MFVHSLLHLLLQHLRAADEQLSCHSFNLAALLLLQLHLFCLTAFCVCILFSTIFSCLTSPLTRITDHTFGLCSAQQQPDILTDGLTHNFDHGWLAGWLAGLLIACLVSTERCAPQHYKYLRMSVSKCCCLWHATRCCDNCSVVDIHLLID